MQIKEDKEYLSDLNEAQKAPVIQKDGPLIVVAGAGSGKTRVLTYRIAYLMDQGIDPFSILALTFTNKAAREMKDRISKVVGQSEAMNLWMGTFHSVFARILRAESNKLGYPSNFTIYDTQDSERLISSIIKEKKFDKDLYKYKQIRSRISTLKNNLITVNAYFNNPELMEADLMSKRPKIGEIYKEYVERTFRAGVMDFDDLLLKTNELLNKFPDVLAKYQERFKYILVDEYQDTNHSQYLIVKALSDRYQNICVVGDDSQSIYSFRGANINNILNFQKDYEDVNLYRLEQNYRSTKNIVNLANSVIKHNLSKIEMDRFVKNKTQIMVATTVIEVGVDVPNASLILIESAERFGLSQLHQLRGRVGRGKKQSYCILMSSNKLSENGKVRLKTMVDTNNGFNIAEVDLKLRGPGDLLGTQQSGIIKLKISDLVKDSDLILLARNEAIKILKNDPGLSSKENLVLNRTISKLDLDKSFWNLVS